MIAKMTQNIEKKMELQTNSLEARIEKMQEIFNKDVEEIKKSQYIMSILFMVFSRQKYWRGLPFPSAEDHILSDLSIMTRPSWVAPLGMA